MSVPCEHLDKIKEMGTRLNEGDKMLTDLRVKQVEIAGDVSHIKTRIDNGMSHTLAEIHEVVIKLQPQIAEHADLYKRVKDAGWALAYIFFGVVCCVIIWAVGKGANIKL